MPVRYPGGRKPTSAITGEMWEKMLNATVIPPFAHLLAWLLDDDVQEWDTIAEIRANLIPALLRRPLEILGDIFHLGDTSEIDISLPVLTNILKPVQDVVDMATGIFGAWFGSTSGATGTIADATFTIEAIHDAVINGWNVHAFTVTEAGWAVPACTELKLIGISGGQNGYAGDADTPVLTVPRGGKHKVVAIDPTGLTGLDVVVPTAGNDLVMRVADATPHTGTELFRVGPGSAGGIAVGAEGYAPTGSNAGDGGLGGVGVYDGSDWTPGSPGSASADAAGGAAGLTYGASGSAGQSVSAGATVKCGGGGGGGGAGGRSNVTGTNGGVGGAGGYPGGAGGNGGGRGYFLVPGSNGAGGAGAPGCGWAMWR
ncbi:hypothetical protein [Gordonia sp. NPDC003376]